jgi:acyl carrier protein
MSHDEIKSRLNKVFCKVFKDDSIIISDETTAKDIEKWDSLTHLILISTTESEFGIKFKLKELIAMKNVGDFMRSIDLKLSA